MGVGFPSRGVISCASEHGISCERPLLKNLLQKLLSAKWLVALALLPLGYYLWGLSASHGDARTLGEALVLAGLFLGIVAGRFVAWLICRLPFFTSGELENRMRAALSSFGFFGAPWAIAVWTNENLGTDITLISWEMHIFWPSVVAVFAFVAAPEGKANK